MSLKPFYSQKCPACQKVSSFDVEALGFDVNCIHCGHSYEARDGDQQSAAIEDPVNFWINFTRHEFDETKDNEPTYFRHPK